MTNNDIIREVEKLEWKHSKDVVFTGEANYNLSFTQIVNHIIELDREILNRETQFNILMNKHDDALKEIERLKEKCNMYESFINAFTNADNFEEYDEDDE